MGLRAEGGQPILTSESAVDAPSRTGQETLRLRAVVRGIVQGVGFRPFVHRLATELELTGWVNNSPQGVFVEVEGPPDRLREFLRRLETERPPHASIQSLEPSYLEPMGFEGFEVRESDESGPKTALILPDIATCPDCLREMLDPADRRHRYPFINCTHCGPRFSIIEALPYDRANTTMRRFTMCPACQAEYDDPSDRRFHAQPNACPVCGPRLALWSAEGEERAQGDEALLATCEAVRRSGIVALKGLGGFHLIADARDGDAVARLRTRKARDDKPFAIMLPSLEAVRDLCAVDEDEARLLRSPEAPITLLRRRSDASDGVADAVAPGNPQLGVMLPYTPLHHLLMRELGFAIVATSGNRSEEPICTDEREAVERLRGIADLFLVHDRPIARHVDDSVARVVAGREQVLRRARGYAPLPITLDGEVSPTLAVGAHLKCAVAVASGRQVFISQHIGDLETPQAVEALRRVMRDLPGLYEITPEVVACDAHPDYVSTHEAERLSPAPMRVQHHVAHVLACLAENAALGPALGVSWDGTGFGPDGTIWGGEFFHVTESGIDRVAHLRRFPLPGGDAAVREPRRSALGLLWSLTGGNIGKFSDLCRALSFSERELAVLRRSLERGINAPLTSSMGRLFDAVACLAGLREISHFEGQAAMELEHSISGAEGGSDCGFEISPPVDVTGPCVGTLDWGPLIEELIADRRRGVSAGSISDKFHRALVEAIVAVAGRVGEERVALTGGCFQNRRLTERAIERLREEGFRPLWHQRIPPNDGGIALGQILAAARRMRED
ncbi:carbamoyltransferase HypF [Candidatus Sumerlaeota bacterium]|nr:carbamoyltransferase HypF [Candidatus Sumerlaeota bacterium]